MNTALNQNGSTEFLNFSDALHHLRWGERIARRTWNGEYLIAVYQDDAAPSIQQQHPSAGTLHHWVKGTDLMAEDWYVL